MDVYKEWLGIPEGQRPPNHYELLRLVQFEDEVSKVRDNYKKLNKAESFNPIIHIFVS